MGQGGAQRSAESWRNCSIPRTVEDYGRGVSDRPDIFTVGELRAAGHVHKDLRHEIRDNLLAALAAGRDPWPGHVRVRPDRPAPARACPDRRARRRPARRTGAGQDAAAAHPGRAAGRVVAGDRGIGTERAPVRTDHGALPRPRPHRRGPAAGGVAPPLGTLRRKARDAGHLRRRPHRRRRPHAGGRGPPARGPGNHPLRPGPALQPRHHRHQRTARPRRADPGRRCST